MNAYEYLQELVRISKKIESGELDAIRAAPLLKAAVEKREIRKGAPRGECTAAQPRVRGSCSQGND